MKRAFSAIILIAFVVVCSCSFVTYKNYVKRATRNAELYDLRTGNAKLLMKATLFTDDFRQEFADKHAEIKYMNAAEKDAWLAEQNRAQASGWEVLVGIYTKRDSKNFSLEPNTFWTAYLTTSMGESVDPISIEKLKVTPYWRVMLPYVDRWTKLYRVIFPKVPLGDKASYTMQSVIGYETVVWKFKNTPMHAAQVD